MKKGKIFITLLVLVGIAVGLYFFALKTSLIFHDEVDEELYRVRGIAVSEEQGEIDWNKVVKEGNISFAFIRATKGTAKKDSKFANNYVKAVKAGLNVGLYHEYIYGNSDETQAKFYINNVKVNGAKIKPIVKCMIDTNLMSTDDIAVFQESFLAYLDLINKNYNKNCIIYTTEETYKVLFDLARFDINNVALENLKTKPLFMDASRWHFWQYKLDATVPGINVPVNKLVYTNTPEDFANWMAHTK